MGFTPQDRLDAQIKQIYDERDRLMLRAPNYTRDHPTAGVAGKQKIYRFKNDQGATIDWLYAQTGWRLTPVRFTGIEITSFVATGKTEFPADEDACEARLKEIEGGKFAKQIPETPLEKHNRLIIEAQSNR